MTRSASDHDTIEQRLITALNVLAETQIPEIAERAVVNDRSHSWKQMLAGAAAVLIIASGGIGILLLRSDPSPTASQPTETLATTATTPASDTTIPLDESPATTSTVEATGENEGVGVRIGADDWATVDFQGPVPGGDETTLFEFSGPAGQHLSVRTFPGNADRFERLLADRDGSFNSEQLGTFAVADRFVYEPPGRFAYFTLLNDVDPSSIVEIHGSGFADATLPDADAFFNVLQTISIIDGNGVSVAALSTATEYDPDGTIVPLRVVPPSDVVAVGVAVGDQVMLSVADELVNAGYIVDAMVSQSPNEQLETVQALIDNPGTAAGSARTVVIHVGNNGQIDPATLNATMAVLQHTERVMVLTSNVDTDIYPSIKSNNELIRSLPERFANVHVIDWAELADDCPGDCFADDGIHLRNDGQRYYAALIAAAQMEPVARPVPDDPCLRQFRAFESAQRIVDAPIEVEINFADGMFLVDTFQNGSFVNRGCTDLFALDPEGTHAVVVSSDETVFVAITTLRDGPRMDSQGSIARVQEIPTNDPEQPAFVEYIELSRSDMKLELLPILPGGAELVAAVAGIEPQGTVTIAMASSAPTNVTGPGEES